MEKYFEILLNLKKEKINVVKLSILDSINAYSTDFSQEEQWEMTEFCYDLWLDSDVDISLSRLADIVADNWADIKSGEMTDEEILDETVCY